MEYKIITFFTGAILMIIGGLGRPNELSEIPNNASILFITGLVLMALTFLT